MAIVSGLSAGTAKHLQLDAGVLCVGVEPSEITKAGTGDLSAILKKATIGATKGGAQFSAVPEFRSLLDGVNGSRGNYKNGQVIDSWDITLKTTVSEMTAANIKIALANNADDNAQEAAGYLRHGGTVGLIANKHYLNNVVWVGTINGQNAPAIIYLKDVINVNGLNFTAEDKATGAIELELKAHFDVAKPDDVPFFVYIPKGGDV